MRYFLVFSAIAIICCTNISWGNDTTQTKPTIKIGIIAPMTGNSSFLGEIFKKSAMIAINEVKAQPTKYNYEFIFEDDQYQARLTNLAAQKLIQEDRVSGLMSVSSVAGNVIKPLAKKSSVLHINDSFDTTIADGKTNFVHTTPPEVLAKRWVALAKEKGWKRVTLVEAVQQACLATSDAIEKEARGSEITIIRKFRVIPGERDFRTFILKIREEKPDAIYIMTLLPEVDIIGKQIREQEPTIPLTSVWSFDVAGDRAPFIGSSYVSTGKPTEEFLAKYKSIYKTDAPQNDLLNSYDYVKLMVFGFENAKTQKVPTGEQAAEAIREQKMFDSLLGKVECTKQGVFLSNASVKIVDK